MARTVNAVRRQQVRRGEQAYQLPVNAACLSSFCLPLRLAYRQQCGVGCVEGGVASAAVQLGAEVLKGGLAMKVRVGGNRRGGDEVNVRVGALRKLRSPSFDVRPANLIEHLST